MKSGQLVCHGTIRDLKNKYSQGFTVLLKLNGSRLNIVVDAVDGAVQLTPASSQKQLLQPAGEELRRPADVDRLKADFEGRYEGACSLKDEHSVSSRKVAVFWFAFFLCNLSFVIRVCCTTTSVTAASGGATCSGRSRS